MEYFISELACVTVIIVPKGEVSAFLRENYSGFCFKVSESDRNEEFQFWNLDENDLLIIEEVREILRGKEYKEVVA